MNEAENDFPSRKRERRTEEPSLTLPARTGDSVTLFLLFLGFFVAFQLILRAQPLSDPGALWHVRVGNLIFERGFFRTDPFTWSHVGQFWIPQQWGGECAMALVHRLGGFDALLTLMNALLAITAAWMCKRFIDGGLHPLPAAAVVGLGMAAAGFHFYLRPHLATIVFTAVFMAWLVDFDRRRIGVGRMVWLIPLSILWTNIHGGVLGGIATIGLALVGWVAAFAKSSRSRIRQNAGSATPRSGGRGYVTFLWLALIVAGCLLGTLVNPFGWDMQRTWIRIVGSSAMKEFVPEHFPLSVKRTDGQAVVGFAVFYFFILAGISPTKWRVTWLIPVVWFVLSLTGIRHGPLFIVTGLIALADFLPETRWFALLKKYGDTYAMAPREPRWFGWPATAGIVAVIGISWGLQAAQVQAPIVGYAWARFDDKLVPVELIEPLTKYAESKPNGHPIFNDINDGGFVLFFAPNLKIFMDDRFELYGDRGLRDYIEMMEDHPERIEEWAKKAPFDAAVVDIDTPMDRYLKESAGWREVKRDRKAVMFVRFP